jgi:hypothetical protein
MYINTEILAERSAGGSMENTQSFLRMIFTNCTPLFACDTLQVVNHKKYHITMIDEANKRARHEKQFPIDLQRASELGARLVRESDSMRISARHTRVRLTMQGA